MPYTIQTITTYNIIEDKTYSKMNSEPITTIAVAKETCEIANKVETKLLLAGVKNVPSSLA